MIMDSTKVIALWAGYKPHEYQGITMWRDKTGTRSVNINYLTDGNAQSALMTEWQARGCEISLCANPAHNGKPAYYDCYIEDWTDHERMIGEATAETPGRALVEATLKAIKAR